MNSSETIKSFLRGRVTIIVGDIAQQHVDAVVNAANSTLFGGGGVDGAIHYAGGPQILEECKEIRRTRYPGGLPAGEAVITSGGNLRARYVIIRLAPSRGGLEGTTRSCWQPAIRIPWHWRFSTA
jgi:O-acetyl-ADP-ribose deacetylase (regulator of RNase III)